MTDAALCTLPLVANRGLLTRKLWTRSLFYAIIAPVAAGAAICSDRLG